MTNIQSVKIVKTISVAKAIWIGQLIVNGPVAILLFGPILFLLHFKPHPGYLGFAVALGDFVSAWLWWSLSVPKWRLYAYERAADLGQLKQLAIYTGLTWPDESFFGRTEIKSAQHAAREKEIEQKYFSENPPLDDDKF